MHECQMKIINPEPLNYCYGQKETDPGSYKVKGKTTDIMLTSWLLRATSNYKYMIPRQRDEMVLVPGQLNIRKILTGGDCGVLVEKKWMTSSMQQFFCNLMLLLLRYLKSGIAGPGNVTKKKRQPNMSQEDS